MSMRRLCVFFLKRRQPPRSTRTDTLFPYTTLFLSWILGATTEKQRKSIADYFAPTLVELRENSAGSNGLFGGESIVDRDNYQHKATQTGTRALTVPFSAVGGPDAGRDRKSVV